nr:cupredoxin domain-containing protein [Hydrogenophaga sp.]
MTRWLAALFMLSALGLAWADDMPTFRLTAREGRFEPAELVVPQGVKFRLEITNAGRDPVEFESLELRKEKVLAPGVTSSLVFRPMAPGRYRFFDDFHQTTGQGAIVAR